MKIDARLLNEAISDLENNRRIPSEEVITALKESMERAYRKEISGKFDDAIVRAEIDTENGVINLYQIKIIKKDVEDDFLEYPLEDALKVDPNYKEGDEWLIPCDIESLRKAFAMAVKGLVKQKLAEKEKSMLMEEFKDKIHTMITGKVESIDEKGATVNIGRATVYLTRRQMIGDENFAAGDPIKLYVVDISSGKAGAHIIVSRSNEGFLRKLFEEEIHDVYDHTIEIKNIAREAGSRSKVAVYCEDPSIDPAGSCIGPSGTRIQKIVNQLGNGTNKEKIDIITYSDVPGLYVLEALKPAKVVGAAINEDNKTATVVVKDDSVSLAIGSMGVNIRLASKLTNYKIDIVAEKDALASGMEFLSLEELQLKNSELIREKLEAKKKAREESSHVSVLPGLPEGYVAPQERDYGDEQRSEVDEALKEEVEEEVVSTPEVVAPKEEVAAVEEKQEETPAAPANTVVETTTTLEALEKALEESDNSKEKKFVRKNKKSNKQADEKEESSAISKVSPEQRMAIYTEEEQKAIEEEEALEREQDYEEDDVDYDDYDEYYDK